MSSNFVSAQPNPALATKLQFDNVHETEEKREDENIQDILQVSGQNNDALSAKLKGSPLKSEKVKNSPVLVEAVKEDGVEADIKSIVGDQIIEADSKVFQVEPEKEKNSRVLVEAATEGGAETDNKSNVGDQIVEADSKVLQVEPEKEKNSVVPAEQEKKSCAIFVDELDDEMCSSYEGHLVDIEEDVSGGYFELDPKLESDIESDDDEDFTLNRLRNKAARFKKRLDPETPSLADLPENKMFIDEFVKYLLQDAESDNEKNPTVPSTTAKLFRHPDSWLVYMKKKNPNFSLDKLTCFQDVSQFVELRDPSDWIDSDQIGGVDGKQQPIRRKEMYKAYKRLIRYILKLLNKEDFGSDILSLVRRDKLKDNLKDIHAEIDASKTWSKLQKVIEKDYQELEKAKATLKPDEKHNAAVANKTYFSSKQFKTRIDKNNQAWQNALDNNKMGSKEFDNLGQFSRHLLAMTDRNRAGGYFFKNADFDARREVWFPPNHNKLKFDGVPEGWDMFTQPGDGREPDAWMITLSGREENVKLGQDVEIIILKLAHDWLLKFRDCKLTMWKDISKFTIV